MALILQALQNVNKNDQVFASYGKDLASITVVSSIKLVGLLINKLLQKYGFLLFEENPQDYIIITTEELMEAVDTESVSNSEQRKNVLEQVQALHSYKIKYSITNILGC